MERACGATVSVCGAMFLARVLKIEQKANDVTMQ
jgi:hypothetical protein